MHRRFARLVGPVLVALPQVLVFWFGTDPLTPTSLVTYLSLTLGGLLFVAAGYLAPLSVGVHVIAGHVLAGLGAASLGLGFAVSGLAAATEAGAAAALYAGSAVLGGAIVVYIGADVARGDRHVRVDGGED